MRHRYIELVFFCAGLLTAVFVYLVLANLLPRKIVPHSGPQQARAVDSAQYARDIAERLRAPLVPGNAVTDYQNGAQFFLAMLADIRLAQAGDLPQQADDRGQLSHHRRIEQLRQTLVPAQR